MQIERVEVIPYALPFEEPYVTARGTLTRREIVLVRAAGNGLTGLGEAVPMSLREGASFDRVVGDLKSWAKSPGTAVAGLSHPARCAIETAMLDLEGRSKGIPAFELLGAAEARPVECNATLTATEPQEVAERALGWAGDGFHSFKLKVGVPKDSDQVMAVRRALGPGAKLRVDANGAWGPAQAVSKLNLMAGEGIELAEQPCPSLEEMAAVRQRTEVPIAADESVASVEDARRAAEIGACQTATVKLSKVGGPRAALGVAAALPCYLSSALDGPVGIAAAAHTAQALRGSGGDAGVAHGLATLRLFSATIASRECELRDGHLHLPEGAGLGVEIDEAALERHRV